MSQATTQPDATATTGDARIVLFGMPDAGKSSLLGALAQSAQSQEHALNGKLVDKTQGLLELQRRLYEERPRETLEEVAPYPVTFEPFPDQRGGTRPTVEAVLFDCDGRVANDLLSKPTALGGQSDGALGRAILAADTLVLVVDASSDPAVLKRDFSQFARFLKLLEEGRGQRSEVGGLPVYLVLAKCDLLAQQNDSTIIWMDRIEERKRQVGRRFEDYLAHQAPAEQTPFGKVKLQMWATAVKRPALSDSPARPRDPYGVAELFRQCMEAAATFRDHRVRAGRRLAWTVGAVGTVLFAMLMLGLFLFLDRPSPEVAELSAKVANFRGKYPSAEKRLREPPNELQAIRKDPNFPRLPPELQDYVKSTLTEMADYQAYEARIREVGRLFDYDLASIKTDDKLAKVKAAAAKEAPGPKREAEWAMTPAVQDWKSWSKELAALAAEVKRTQDGYERLLVDAEKIAKLEKKKGVTLDEMAAAAKAIGERWKKLPDRAANAKDTLPGADELTYEQVFRFPEVEAAYTAWHESPLRKKVATYADLRP
jgi:GTPase SAR1 family protein